MNGIPKYVKKSKPLVSNAYYRNWSWVSLIVSRFYLFITVKIVEAVRIKYISFPKQGVSSSGQVNFETFGAFSYFPMTHRRVEIAFQYFEGFRAFSIFVSLSYSIFCIEANSYFFLNGTPYMTIVHNMYVYK